MSDHPTPHQRYEQILHSDRAAVDLGVFTLKVVMTINAGALIALLAAIDRLNGAPGACQFLLGLMAAALAALLSYFYQSLVTEGFRIEFHADFSTPGIQPPYNWTGKPAGWLIVIVIALVLASYGLFGWGAWLAIDSIS